MPPDTNSRREGRGAETSPRHRGATGLEVIAMGVIEAGWLVALALVPLVVNPFGERGYEPDKIALFRSIVVVMAIAWSVSAVRRFWRYIRVPRRERSELRLPRWARSPVTVGVAVLGVSTVLSSMLSVDSRLSWAGSFERMSGGWTQLAYLTFFVMVAAHFRRRSQWRRAAYVIVLTSSLVALYGVLQFIGLDPRWTEFSGSRIYSTTGNPIFLAGYLGMAVFVTAIELRTAMATTDRKDLPTRSLRVLLWVILGLQLGAIVLTQSRGPLLALGAGSLATILIGTALLRERGIRPQTVTHLRRALLAAITLGLAVLVVAALPGSPLAGSRDVPILSRVSTALDLEAGSTRVRVAIWEAATDRLTSATPIVAPDGEPNGLSGLRPLLGHGPETFRIAVDRHIGPELARLAWAPDRAHNEVLDVLVTHGAVGLAALLTVQVSLLVLGLHLSGELETRTHRRRSLLALVGGIGIGAIVPWAMTGSWSYSGVWASGGLTIAMLGVVTFITRRPRETPRPPAAASWMAAGVLGALVTHFSDLAVGIPTSSTTMLFWFLAAVLVALASGSFTEGGEPLPRASARGYKGPSKRRAAARDRRDDSDRWVPIALGLVVAATTVPIALMLLSTATTSMTTADAIGTALSGEGGVGGPGALLWLFLWALLAGGILCRVVMERARWTGRFLVAASAPSLAYVLLQASRTSRVATLQRSDLLGAVDYALDHITIVFAIALGAVLLTGAALAATRIDRVAGGAVGAGFATAVVVIGAILAAGVNLGPIRADMLSQQGTAFSAAGLDGPALEMTELARAADTDEPRYRAADGAAAAAAATRTTDPAEREALLQRALVGFEGAVELAPLDPDHHANLGRMFVLEAQFVDEGHRRDLLIRAASAYDAALTLRPASITVLEEAAAVHEQLGQTDRAEDLLDAADALRTADSRAMLRSPGTEPVR